MKIAPRDIAGFLARPDNKAAAILVYGPDAGLVQERLTMLQARFLGEKPDPMSLISLSGDAIAAEPALFYDEANAMALFGPASRIVKIAPAGDSCTPVLKDYAAAPNPDVRVLLAAGNLGTKSPLRQWAEKESGVYALPCYVENEQELQRFITEYCREAQIPIDMQTSAYLASQLTGDRLLARRQMERIALYKGTARTPLSMADIQLAVPDLAQQSLDDVVYAAFDAQFPSLFRALDSLLAESTSFVLILRSLQHHARRLEQVHLSVQSGLNLDVVLKQLQPPVFFKLEPRFRQHLRNWPVTRLQALQGRFLELEADLKTYGADMTAPLLGQFLLTTMSLPKAA